MVSLLYSKPSLCILMPIVSPPSLDRPSRLHMGTKKINFFLNFPISKIPIFRHLSTYNSHNINASLTMPGYYYHTHITPYI